MLVLAGVVAVGALVAALLLLRAAVDDGAGAEHVAAGSTTAAPASPGPASAPPAAGKSVLLDVEGAVIEEFSGDCADKGRPRVNASAGVV
ncbi:hypothetical protein AB0D67_19340 [Streptosporangium sp. NPDC048047]|uniref:hypothetical protein n=1 Tax=Streptosporangium sp. NPDC048047 TaxID=3155748 RepID=UPI0034496A0C